MTDSQRPTHLSQVLDELKKEYLDKLPGKLEKIKKLTQSQDWAQVEEEYHKLKGTGKTYGFPEISLICERMEALAHAQQDPSAELFEKAVTLLEKVHQCYLENKPVELDSDAFARSLLALKLK